MNLIVRHICLLLILTLLSCSDDEPVVIPAEVIPMDIMSQMISDMTLIEAVKNLNASKEADPHVSIFPFYKEIYERFDVTEEEFKSSFTFYEAHQGLMTEIYEGVTQDLLMRQDIAKKKNNDGDRTSIKELPAPNKKVQKPGLIPQR